MTGQNDEPMLDRGRVGVMTLIAIAGFCIAAAIEWQGVKTDAQSTKDRLTALETDSGKIDKLTMVICLDTPERVARCRDLGLLR